MKYTLACNQFCIASGHVVLEVFNLAWLPYAPSPPPIPFFFPFGKHMLPVVRRKHRLLGELVRVKTKACTQEHATASVRNPHNLITLEFCFFLFSDVHLYLTCGLNEICYSTAMADLPLPKREAKIKYFASTQTEA